MILAKRLAHDLWLRQADIARKAGLDYSTVSRIFNGILKPYPSHAKKIADCLGYDGDLDALFSDDGCCPYCGKPLG